MLLRSGPLRWTLTIIAIAVLNFTSFGRSRPVNIVVGLLLVLAIVVIVVRSRRKNRHVQ